VIFCIENVDERIITMGKKDVKVIDVKHNVFGNPNKKEIEKVIKKWLGKGYRLDRRDEIEGGWGSRDHTQLIFIKDD
jgi:hypothetical protein